MMHLLMPIVDASKPIVHTMEVEVAAGQPVALQATGAGAQALLSAPLHLGQVLDPFNVSLVDAAGASAHKACKGVGAW